MFGFSKAEKEKELRDLEEEQGTLNDVYNAIATEAYKDRVLDPIEEYIEVLKKAYECESLEELAYNRGKFEAYKEIIDLHENIQKQKQNIEYEMETLKQG